MNHKNDEEYHKHKYYNSEHPYNSNKYQQYHPSSSSRHTHTSPTSSTSTAISDPDLYKYHHRERQSVIQRIRTMPRSNKKRDPLAPKRNLSAYLLYQNAMRDTFRARNPGMDFGEYLLLLTDVCMRQASVIVWRVSVSGLDVYLCVSYNIKQDKDMYIFGHMGWDWIGWDCVRASLACCVGVCYSADVDAFVDSIGDGCPLQFYNCTSSLAHGFIYLLNYFFKNQVNWQSTHLPCLPRCPIARK